MSLLAQINNAAHTGAFGHNPRSEPTLAQLAAGNYKKGVVMVKGLSIAIENPAYTYRKGMDKTGQQWMCLMQAHYGYIQGHKGNDGDDMDVFIGVAPENDTVYIVNQKTADGYFDEHKIMLGFLSQQQAVDTYTHCFERGMTGLMSVVPCTMTQFKWWLANGNKSRPVTLDRLPYAGLERLDSVNWGGTDGSNLYSHDGQVHKLLYQIRQCDDTHQALEPLAYHDMIAELGNQGFMYENYDALIVEYNKLEKKAKQLLMVMQGAADTVKPVGVTVSKPLTKGGVANVVAWFEMDDGQAVGVFFHNPDKTPKKINPTDEMISYKWVLNKKDITIAVAPEQGKDLIIRTVAKRIMQLVEKNHDRFIKANGDKAALNQAEQDLTAQVAEKQATLKGLQDEVVALQGRKAEKEALAGILAVNKDLQKQIDEAGANSQELSVVDKAFKDFSVKNNIPLYVAMDLKRMIAEHIADGRTTIIKTGIKRDGEQYKLTNGSANDRGLSFPTKALALVQLMVDEAGKQDIALTGQKEIDEVVAGQSSAPKPSNKRTFTYAIKQAAETGKFYIQSDDGGGVVLSRRPSGFGILDATPWMMFDTEDKARKYLVKKGMTEAEKDFKASTIQPQEPVTLTGKELGDFEPIQERPSNWRTNLANARAVAKSLGIETKGKKLERLIKDVDIFDDNEVKKQVLAEFKALASRLVLPKGYIFDLSDAEKSIGDITRNTEAWIRKQGKIDTNTIRVELRTIPDSSQGIIFNSVHIYADDPKTKKEFDKFSYQRFNDIGASTPETPKEIIAKMELFLTKAIFPKIEYLKVVNSTTLDTVDLPSLGVANIESIGNENIFIEKDGKYYISKVGNTENYALGEWDFAKYPEAKAAPVTPVSELSTPNENFGVSFLQDAVLRDAKKQKVFAFYMDNSDFVAPKERNKWQITGKGTSGHVTPIAKPFGQKVTANDDTKVFESKDAAEQWALDNGYIVLQAEQVVKNSMLAVQINERKSNVTQPAQPASEPSMTNQDRDYLQSIIDGKDTGLAPKEITAKMRTIITAAREAKDTVTMDLGDQAAKAYAAQTKAKAVAKLAEVQ